MASEPLQAQYDDPFALLGIEPSFELDGAALQRAWLQKAARAHPDRVEPTGEPPVEIAKINWARQALTDPERRAGALLRRIGGPSKEDDKSLPEGFLLEIMEIRQRAEEARATGDREGESGLRNWAATRREELLGEVGGLFSSSGDPPSEDVLRRIRLLLNALRYIERMLEQVETE